MSVDMNLMELVGSGPFIVREYIPGKSIKLLRNPHYWKVDRAGQPLPYLDAVEFLISRDLQAAVDRFESGETHIHDVSSSDYERLKRTSLSSDFSLFDLGPSYTSNYLMFNLDPGRSENGQVFLSAL